MSGIERTRQKGFTIVELLIVIVVVGILATISVVAYNGSQQRARNAARLAAVTNAIETVEVALTKYAPSQIRATLYESGSWYRACIGTGYKQVGSTPGVCGYYSGSGPYVWEVATFTNLLKETAGSLDMSGYPLAKSTDNDHVAGPYLTSAWVDSKNMLAVEYSLEGEGQKCDKSPLIYRVGSSSTMTPPAGDAANYTKSAYGVTECVVAVVTDYY